MNRTIVEHGKAFRALLGIYPYGTNPGSSNVFDHPKALRQTMTVGAVGSTPVNSGQMGLVGTLVAGQTARITVANNSFVAPAEVVLGGYRILANVDFVPGAGVNDTAANLATAINQFPGFSATANLAVVSVLYAGDSASDVDFKVMHYGAVANFTVSPTTGLMTKGSPQVSAPLVT